MSIDLIVEVGSILSQSISCRFTLAKARLGDTLAALFTRDGCGQSIRDLFLLSGGGSGCDREGPLGVQSTVLTGTRGV